MSQLDRELIDQKGPFPDWFTRALSVPFTEGTVSVDGCPIHYMEWGDRSKPGIVMVHGFMAHARCFSFIAPFLAEDHHVVAYDFSGQGDSGVRESYPADVRAREIVEVARHTGMYEVSELPVVIAHSYGSSIGMAAMERYGDQLGAIVICDLMLLRPERHEAYMGQSSMSKRRNRAPRPHRVYPDLESILERFVLAPDQPCENGFLKAYVARHSVRQTDEGFSWKFHPSSYLRDDHNGPDWWRELPARMIGLSGRIAMVHGERSLLCDRDSADYLRELGATFPIVTIPHAHHHLMLDQPIAFVSALRTLLATRPWPETT